MIGKTISHYKITEKLGQGGMGIIYKAQDLKLDRFVALKFLPPHLTSSEDEKQRFIHEAKAASSLDHNNICNIYEIDETEDGQLFISMAYYEGETLDKRIKDKPLPIEEAIDIAIQIARGLAKAHEKDIVHRDIKPANIMLTKEGVVKVLDFGLAKLSTQTKLTKKSTTLGTVAYMSPEQAKGEEVDYRTDIWSLGIILYEMLTGQLPFKGEYESAVIYSIMNDTQEPVTGLRTGVPMELERIINKCLQKSPAERFQHMDELIVDLHGVRRQTESTITPTVKEPPMKRHKSVIISVAVLSILILIVAGYFLIDQNMHDEKPESKLIGAVQWDNSIAVLPFDNISDDPAHEFLCDGMTVQVISNLGRLPNLKVIRRQSVMKYKDSDKSITEIGKELNVEHILESSLQKSGNRIRVISQLFSTKDGVQIWSENLNEEYADLFDVQDEISEKIARALLKNLSVSDAEQIKTYKPANIEAYDYYLRGISYHFQIGRSKENYSVAEEMYLKAVGLDSNFALSYIRLAQINIRYYWTHWDRNESRLTRAKNYIDKAIEINPDIPEIYVALGQYYYRGFLAYDKALLELENGLKIFPDNGDMLEVIGYIKRRQGKFEEAISYLIKSVELNPFSRQNMNIGVTYFLLRKYDEAEKYVDIAISNIPPQRGEAYFWKAKIHIFRNGDVDRAFQILNGGLDIVNQEKLRVTFLLVQFRILDGKYEEALKMLSAEHAKGFENQFKFQLKSQILATIYRLQNKNNLAKDYYDSARVVIEEKLKELPDDSRIHSALGIVLAGLGKKNEAIREGIRATELLPITKESRAGFLRELDLAKIYTMVGEYDLAIDKLEYLLSIPGEVSVPYIKLDPVWRPLLEIPRLQEILAKY